MGTDQQKCAEARAERALRSDAARNRERVIEAARIEFAERGFDATLDDVARRAGVGVGTVYRRFPNKEALVEALFTQRIDEFILIAAECLEDPDPWHGFADFLARSFEIQARDKGIRDVMLHGEYGREQVAKAKERILPAITKLLDRAQASGQLRPDLVGADIPMLATMICSVADYSLCEDPGLWHRYLGVLLDGLMTSRDEPSRLCTPPSADLVAQTLSRRS